MIIEFAPKSPREGTSVLRKLDLSALIEALGGGELGAPTVSMVAPDPIDAIPLSVSLEGFSEDGLIVLRFEGGTIKTQRFGDVLFTLQTPNGMHTDNVRFSIVIQH